MAPKHDVDIKIIFFSVSNGALVTYVSNRRIPQSTLQARTMLDDEVARLIHTSVGLTGDDGFVEQLYTRSDPETHDRIVVVYYMLVAPSRVGNATSSNWLPATDLQAGVPDDEILFYAIQRLQWKIEYTNVVYSLLPDEFTFAQLQGVYEAILGRRLDKRNFRKKILSLGILKDTGKKQPLGRARPAETYCFKDRKLSFVEIL